MCWYVWGLVLDLPKEISEKYAALKMLGVFHIRTYTQSLRTMCQFFVALIFFCKWSLSIISVKSAEEYAEIMKNLKLSNPKMMDIAVPANRKGLTLKDLNTQKWV